MLRRVFAVWSLLPALLPAQQQEPSVDFARSVAPILVQRCIECHGPLERKGDLRLDARAFVFPQEQQDEWSIVPGKPEASELIRRIALPRDDEDAMPNKGESLTAAQQEILRRWVAEGASWPADGDQVIAAAVAAAAVPVIAYELPAITAAQQAAIDAAVAALRQKGAVVQRVGADSPALEVNLSLLRDKAGDAELALLLPLAPVLVALNASRTGITDDSAQRLAALTQLRRLHVAATALSGAAFAACAALPQLEFLNAYGTGIDDAALAALGEGKHLRRLYAWQTKVTGAAAQALRERHPALRVDLGDYAGERLAAAERAISQRDRKEALVNTTCPVRDKPVDPAQTLEHDGRRIGFCCEHCKAEFQKDPARFLGKLPPVGGNPK